MQSLLLKISSIIFFLYSSFSIFTQQISVEDIENNAKLKELYTVNIGIMKPRELGTINSISPIITENIVNTIRNELDIIDNVRLSEKDAYLKLISVYLKNSKNPLESMLDHDIQHIEKSLGLSNKNNVSDKVSKEILRYVRKDTELNKIVGFWVQNKTQPLYNLDIKLPFDRIIANNIEIATNTKINSNAPLDYMFYGSIEKIDNEYFIAINVYSSFSKKDIAGVSLLVDSDNISDEIVKKLRKLFAKVFNINYGSLNIVSETPESDIYIDGIYKGKESVYIDYIKPGNYVVTLKNNEFFSSKYDVSIKDFEEKEMTVSLKDTKELQEFYFDIEPYGTKIFINSIFMGVTPFSKVLPRGNYVISAKNSELYKDHRYVVTVDEITNERKNIVFHLPTINFENHLLLKKKLYYISFWNFTFSLTGMIPITILSNYFFYRFPTGQQSYYDTTELEYYKTEEGRLSRDVYSSVFYGLAAFSIVYTVLSTGWLFFSLYDYLSTLEKKDFIPIIDYYRDKNGQDNLTIGGSIKL